MSRDYINDLSPELLYMVFDCLHSDTRGTVAEVCQHWSEIISNNPSTDETELVHLSPRELAISEEEIRYRNVKIDVENFETEYDDSYTFDECEWLEKYLFNQELMENLVELSIDQALCMFERETDIYLPNLHTLHITYGRRDYVFIERLPPLRCRLIAPKLRTFHQKCETMREPLLMYSEQIETFSLHVLQKGDMLSMMGNMPFAKVRNLTLNVFTVKFHKEDFNAELRALFGRVSHLKLDGRDTFYPVLGFIIGEANNLRSLEIHDHKIDQDTLLQIRNLKNLEELTLIVNTNRSPSESSRIVLSQLKITKLKIDLDALDSLESLPCLKSLHLVGELEKRLPELTALLRPVADHLERLHLSSASLTSDFIDAIGSLGSLSVLSVERIEGESLMFEELLSRLNKLRIARFEQCILYETMPRKADRECSVRPDQNLECWPIDSSRQEEYNRFRTFIEQQSMRYIDCAIVVCNGRLEEKRVKVNSEWEALLMI